MKRNYGKRAGRHIPASERGDRPQRADFTCGGGQFPRRRARTPNWLCWSPPSPPSNPATLIDRAIAIARQFPDEVTESGTPVSDLALLLALRHVTKGNLPQDLVTGIENSLSRHPSWLSPTLLDAVAAAATTNADKTTAARLRADWQREENSRESTRSLVQTFYFRLLYRNSAPYPGPARRYSPSLLEFRKARTLSEHRKAIASPPNGLAFCSPHSWGWQVTLVQLALRKAIHLNLPDYMGASLRLNGEVFNLDQGRTGQPLTYANGNFSFDTTYPFQLVLDLRNPSPALCHLSPASAAGPVAHLRRRRVSPPWSLSVSGTSGAIRPTSTK